MASLAVTALFAGCAQENTTSTGEQAQEYLELVMSMEYPGLQPDKWGIYILSEAIKRGKDRVDISKLKKSDISGRELTGGYLLRIDTFDEDDATFTSKVPGIGEGNMSTEVIWSCIYPKKKKLQPEQLTYIQNYIDTVEQVIQSEYFADPAKGYSHYIDVPSFVDYFKRNRKKTERAVSSSQVLCGIITLPMAMPTSLTPTIWRLGVSRGQATIQLQRCGNDFYKILYSVKR